MTWRSGFLSVVALGAAALTPQRAQAQACTGGYTFSLGLGGSLSGCFTGVLTQLGEDAGYVSNQYYWAGNFGGESGATNAPTVAGTFMFDNDCGSAGSGTFAFCTGSFAKPPAVISNNSGELVLGLMVPDDTYGTGFYWDYSGSDTRNAVPPPPGYQDVLLQLTIGGVDDPGQFLFGWEDLNTGCTQRGELNNDRYPEEQLGNASMLNTVLEDCIVIAPGGNSDNDFNDSYMRFDIEGTGTLEEVTPEPMTASLMAIGLVALSGVSRRRRRHG